MIFCCAAASAADDPLKVSMQLSTRTFSEPGPVTVSIQVANSGEGDLEDPVTLYYPNGKQVEAFGSPVLTVGTSKTWTGEWNVTQAQLEAGKITFKIKYTVYDDEGNKVSKTKNFYKTIEYTGAVTSVEVNRTISATTAAEGQEVNITYRIVNTGTVAISDVVIAEDSSISSTKGTIQSVAAGESATYTFTTTMAKKNLTSHPTITYTASGSTQSVTKEAATIKYGEVNLTASLSADKKGAVVGDTVTLTLTLKNTGKTDYTGLSITDASLGTLFSDVAVAAGQSTILTKEISLVDTADYAFAVSGEDAEGTEISISSNRVSVTALQADQVVTLAVNAEADRDTVYNFPATVKFHVSVTNSSAIDVTNVVVKASGVTLYTFPTILAGETRDFTRDVSVSMSGKYQFVASVTNQLGETESFESNILPIAYSEPTAEPTSAPIVTPPRPNLVEVPTEVQVPEEAANVKSLTEKLTYVFLGLAGVGVIFLLVAIIGRIVKAGRKSRIKASFDLVSPRDYLAGDEEEAPGEEAPVTEPEENPLDALQPQDEEKPE